jgi:hypothetical protein
MARDAADIGNGFKPEVVQNLVRKIEGYFSDLDHERGVYMKRCRDIRDRVSAVYDEAVGHDIPKKELRKFVTARIKLEAARKVLADLEDDQRETVQMLAEAFGDAADLPLFEHRMQAARDNGQQQPQSQPVQQ